MKKILFVSFLTTLISFLSSGQEQVNWISLEEAETLNKTNPKPMIIDFYTHWCHWCKVMDRTTYQTAEIVDYINQNFYAVKFNAEATDTIVYQEQVYTNANGSTGGGRGKPHPLAIKLLNGKLSYPTTLFFDAAKRAPLVFPGYAKPEQFMPCLTFYHEKLYSVTNINQLIAEFEKANKIGATKRLNTYTIQEAFQKNQLAKKTNDLALKKKTLLFFDNPLVVSNNIMKQLLQDSSIASYLNESFYTVPFNVYSSDTVAVFDTVLTHSTEYPFHSLVYGLIGKNLTFPSIVFFDEENNFITQVPQYLDSKMMPIVFEFFEKDYYQTMSYAEYQKQRAAGTLKREETDN